MSDEFVQPSDHLDIKPEISQELAGMDVKATQERPNLTSEHKGMMEHAGSSLPAPTLTSSSNQLPTKDEAGIKLRNTQPDDSERGRLLLIIKNDQRGAGVKAA